MSNSPDRCSQLYTLQAHLTNQLKLLKEGVQKAQREGIVTSAETLSTIKRLQSSLQNVQLELQKCPPESKEMVTVSPQSTTTPKAFSSARWSAENGEPDVDDDEDFG